jgi:hypothetical protein
MKAKLVSVVACLALLGGCFGYNSSAKKWSYIGDAVLILAGGAAIAVDQTNKPAPCMTTSTMECTYQSPVRGGLVAGIVLASAGLFGMIFNATRTNVKTSR